MPWGFFKVSMERYSSPSGRHRPRSPQHVNCTFAEDPPDRVNKFKGSFYIMWARLLKPFVSFLLMKTRPVGGLRESELLNHDTTAGLACKQQRFFPLRAVCKSTREITF